jgi:hypothetical protein
MNQLYFTHFRANAEKRGTFLRILETYGAAAMHEKFSWCVEHVPRPMTDWNAALDAKGLPAEHFVGIGVPYWHELGTFGFERRDGAPDDLPPLVIFSIGELYDAAAVAAIIESRPGPHPPVFHGQVATFDDNQTWIYGEAAGTHRDNVDDGFIDLFKPHEYVTDASRVRQILEFAAPTVLAGLAPTFLDNWNEADSFMLVHFRPV